MQPDIYSPLKIFHHQEKLAVLRSGGQPSPLHVQIIPTNRCTQNCNFCSYRSIGYSSNQRFNSGDEIHIQKIQEILDDCVKIGVKAIEITGGGEPLWHHEAAAILDGVVSRGLNLGLVTNGKHATESMLGSMLKAKWVRFSLDSATPATYATIRRDSPQTFEKVRNSIRLLTQEKKRTGQHDPVVGIGFVVTRDNWKEIGLAVDNAISDGADNIRISAVFQNGGAEYFCGFGDLASAYCSAAMIKTTADFKVFNNFDDRFNDLSQGHPDYNFCGFQHICTYIGADLNVYRCCVLAYNDMGLLGSLKDKRFADFWESLEKRELMGRFSAKSCPRCMFNNKNNTIAYAICKEPPHVNFI